MKQNYVQGTTCGSITGNQSAKDVAVAEHEPRQVGEGSRYAKEFKIYYVGNIQGLLMEDKCNIWV